MRSSVVLVALLQAFQFTQIAAAPIEGRSDLVQRQDIPTTDAGIDKNKPTVILRREDVVAELSERDITANDVEVLEFVPGPVEREASTDDIQEHGIEKRAVNIKLMADTGSHYRIRVRGTVIILRIFYDLAVNIASMSWEADSSNPAPGSLTFGAFDRDRLITVNPRPIPHGQKIPLAGFRIGDIINIFNGA